MLTVQIRNQEIERESREQQFHALLKELRDNVQQRGAFAGLAHDEILTALRQTRDKIWETEYLPQYENFLGHVV